MTDREVTLPPFSVPENDFQLSGLVVSTLYFPFLTLPHSVITNRTSVLRGGGGRDSGGHARAVPVPTPGPRARSGGPVTVARLELLCSDA